MRPIFPGSEKRALDRVDEAPGETKAEAFCATTRTQRMEARYRVLFVVIVFVLKSLDDILFNV